MIGDVNTNLLDAGLGAPPKGEDGQHLKVGSAEGGDANKIYEFGSYFDAKLVLISGPLLDAIKQHYEEFSKEKDQVPPRLFVCRPVNDVVGTISTVVKTGTGTATNAASGTVTGTRQFVIEIILGGASATATYRKSTDGGKTWSGELTTPASASPISMGAGVSIAFTDGVTPSASFVAGDKYEFSCAGPTASLSNTLTAIRTAKQFHDVKFIHVMGSFAASFWVTLAALRAEWITKYKHPVVIICESAARDAETVAEYALARINEAKSSNVLGVYPIFMRGRYSATGEYRNLATVLAAKIAAARVHESPGFVDKFAFLTVTELEDYDALSNRDDDEKSWLDLLQENGYIVAVKYENYPGFYFGSPMSMVPSTSSFNRLQKLRTADKVCVITRRAILRYIQSPNHAEAGLGGVVSLKTEIDNTIGSRMEVKGNRELDSHDTILDKNQAKIKEGIVQGKLKIKFIDTMESIELDVAEM